MRYLMIVIIVLTLLTGCAQQGTVESIDEEIIYPVKVTEIVMTENYRSISNIGAVTIDESVKVGFKVAGKISNIYVEEGVMVKEDDLLATLDPSDYQLDLDVAANQLNAAREAYAYAKDTFDRVEKLFNEGYSSQDEFDQVKLNLDVRTSEYQQAQVNYRAKSNQMNDTKIYSPIDGSVLSVLNEPGEFTSAGYPVIIVRGSENVIKVGIPSNEVVDIRVGLACNIDIDGNRYIGVIENIAEVPDATTRNYEVVIGLPDDNVKIGALAKIDIPTEKYSAIWVPIDTIMHKGDDYVFVVVENTVVKKNIRIVGTKGNMAEVTGLAVGDQMITSNARLVKAGDIVSVQE